MVVLKFLRFSHTEVETAALPHILSSRGVEVKAICVVDQATISVLVISPHSDLLQCLHVLQNTLLDWMTDNLH